MESMESMERKENMENMNTLVLSDAEVQLLSFFIDMKFPEFLAEGVAKDMFCIAAISKVFSWCQEVMIAHGIDAMPYDTYKKETEEEMNRMIAAAIAHLAEKGELNCGNSGEAEAENVPE